MFSSVPVVEKVIFVFFIGNSFLWPVFRQTSYLLDEKKAANPVD